MCTNQVYGMDFAVAATITITFAPTPPTGYSYTVGVIQRALLSGIPVYLVGYSVPTSSAIVSATIGGNTLHDGVMVANGATAPIRVRIDPAMALMGSGIVLTLTSPAAPALRFGVWFEVGDLPCK